MRIHKIVDRFEILPDTDPDFPPGMVLVIDFRPEEEIESFVGKRVTILNSDTSKNSHVVGMAKHHIVAVSFFFEHVSFAEMENATDVGIS